MTGGSREGVNEHPGCGLGARHSSTQNKGHPPMEKSLPTQRSLGTRSREPARPLMFLGNQF